MPRVRQGVPINKKLRFVVTIIFIFCVIYVSFIGRGSFYRLHKVKQRRDKAYKQNLKLVEDIERIDKDIELLKNDAEYIERIGREEFNLQKPNEKVYRIIDENSQDETEKID